MRFILIDSTCRRVFDCATPIPLGEELISRILRSDHIERVSLAPELDLWVSSESWKRTFQFFRSGPEFAGNGFLCGRTKLGDFKSLPRWLSFETVTAWVSYPEQRIDVPQPRRKYQRPTGFPLIGLPLETYHGIAPGSARENPYVMQMYG